MSELKAQSERALREEQQRHDRSLRAWDERVRFRREEVAAKQRNADALELARRRHAREHRTYIGLPLTTDHRLALLAELTEEIALHKDDPQVVRLRTWFEDVCAREGVFYQTAAAPELRNGSSWRALREILIAPIQSFETAAVAAHELGHVLADVDPNAQRIDGGPGRSICVAAEIAAWRWALDHAPVWNRDMHTRMTECLASYRNDGTDAEKQQIDALCSFATYADARLRCARLE